jgi:hypothetical protein
MSLLNNIRFRIGNYRFQKELKGVKREHKFINFKDAKSIGIIFDGSNDSEHPTIFQYIKSIQKEKKNVSVLGYLNRKDSPQSTIKKMGFDYFTRKDVNWYMVPNNQLVKKFLNEQFDILININSENCFPIQYISGLSKAKLRVGRYNEESAICYDFMINMKGSPNLRNYFEQVDHYLNLINKTND